MTRFKNKHYFRIPFGEIQFGTVTHSVVIWFRGRRYIIWAGTRR